MAITTRNITGSYGQPAPQTASTRQVLKELGIDDPLLGVAQELEKAGPIVKKWWVDWQAETVVS